MSARKAQPRDDDMGWEAPALWQTWAPDLAKLDDDYCASIPTVEQKESAELSATLLVSTWASFGALWLSLWAVSALCKRRRRGPQLPQSSWKGAQLSASAPPPASIIGGPKGGEEWHHSSSHGGGAATCHDQVGSSSAYQSPPYTAPPYEFPHTPSKYGFPEDEAMGYLIRGRQLTKRLLAELQRTPEFYAHLVGSGKSMEDVVRINKQLHTYQSLRDVDPSGFRRLWDDTAVTSLQAHSSRAPGRITALAVYVEHQLLPLAIYGWLAARFLYGVPVLAFKPAEQAQFAGLWLGMAYAVLLRRHASLFGLVLGFRWRCASHERELSNLRLWGAHVTEVVLVAASAGLCIILSVLMICVRAKRQCLGETLLGIVLERK